MLRTSLEERDNVVDGPPIEQVYPLSRLIGGVRCHYHLLTRIDGMLGDEGFIGEDIQTGTGQLVGCQCCSQRIQIHDRPPGAIE